MSSNQTSLQPGDSAPESQGANGLQTAKLSPISGNTADAVAELRAPVLSAEHSHPYSNMSAEDYNAEPDGLIGLTVQPGYVDGEAITNPNGKRARVQRLFTSTVSGPTHTVAVDNDFDLVSFCQCDCGWCSERLSSVINRDQDSAKRKPIPRLCELNLVRRRKRRPRSSGGKIMQPSLVSPLGVMKPHPRLANCPCDKRRHSCVSATVCTSTGGSVAGRSFWY